MAQTLDQQRAAFAWGRAVSAVSKHGKEYKVLAKGAPALIMNSGLMPALAFYNQKGNSKNKKEPNAADQLRDDLIHGLLLRLPNKLASEQNDELFQAFMQKLQGMSAIDYLRYTDEALELLKWIRQFVDVAQNQGVAP